MTAAGHILKMCTECYSVELPWWLTLLTKFTQHGMKGQDGLPQVKSQTR